MSTRLPPTVYLDYASTTPIDPRVAEAMIEVLRGESAFGNPSSTHVLGLEARDVVEHAREQVARAVGAHANEIVWTSSATEANNLAILGVARHAARALTPALRDRNRVHIITSRTEHKSVLNPCKQLEREGCNVTYLKPRADGTVDPQEVEQAFQSHTALVSIMHLNNELGAVNDIATIGHLCRARHIAFHVDAAQSMGKLALDVHALAVDLLSLSAHKAYGPKGVGALYVRRDPPLGLEPLLFGGGQENGRRSGTLPTHQIVGMGLAFEIATAKLQDDWAQLAPLRERLERGLAEIGGVLHNPPRTGDGAAGHARTAAPKSAATDYASAPRTMDAPGGGSSFVPHILNASFDGVNGESLLASLDGLAVSSGSTCNSAMRESSYVLRALGRSDEHAEASLRFSLGRGTTGTDIDRAIEIVSSAVHRLRAMSPATGIPADARTYASGEAGSAHQGTWIRWLLRIADGTIGEARYQVYGCPHTMAACEWLQAHLTGRALKDPLPEGAAGLAAAIHAPPEKLGRLLVIEDALRAACAAGC